MASNKTVYTAESFKKDKKVDKPVIITNEPSKSSTSDDGSSIDLSSDCSDDSESIIREYDDDDDESESTSSDDFEEDFNNEDRLVSRLYREVVDELMQNNKLREFKVNVALDEMKLEIWQGHKKGFRRFRGIDFNKPKNCCGYLRRYAVCHTGLVKQIMWKFFKDKKGTVFSKFAKKEILTESHLKVVSLGGGPGNDLVGFCSALQEIGNSVKELDLYVIDICKGWKTVFPTILQKAARGNFGSFSEYIKKVKINTGFMAADLTAKGILVNEHVSSCLALADVVLMVKLTSFLPDSEAGDLISNVVDCMKPEAKLIFIDQPYDGDFFKSMKSLNFIYHDRVKYNLSFNPARYQSPSIESTQAHVGIHEKKVICPDEDPAEIVDNKTFC